MDTAPSADVVTRSQAKRLHATQGTSEPPGFPGRFSHIVRILTEDFGICLPPQVARAELTYYLTTCSSVFRMSRLDARQYVTDEMLRASALEIAGDYRGMIKKAAG